MYQTNIFICKVVSMTIYYLKIAPRWCLFIFAT